MSGPPEVVARREALIRLGDEVRALTEALVSTEVSAAEIDAAAAAVRAVVAPLTAVRRAPGELASVDDLAEGIRLFNPVRGPRTPSRRRCGWRTRSTRRSATPR